MQCAPVADGTDDGDNGVCFASTQRMNGRDREFRLIGESPLGRRPKRSCDLGLWTPSGIGISAILAWTLDPFCQPVFGRSSEVPKRSRTWTFSIANSGRSNSPDRT